MAKKPVKWDRKPCGCINTELPNVARWSSAVSDLTHDLYGKDRACSA